MFSTFATRAVAVAAVFAAAGCTVKNNEAPALSGPSGLALTLRLSAIPDSISQDGGSQSAVKVTAIGPDGKPVVALPLRVDMNVGGAPQDFGTLSARTIVTNNDGVASVVYTAPPSPPNGQFGTCNGLPGTCVAIVATATGTNFVNANPETVNIRLVPPGVILPPASTPTAAFTFSPTVVSANIPVQFDASSSTPGSGATSITSYSWSFGDGTTGSGKTVSHTYTAGNTFSVTLTVTNDRGLSASASQQLGVGIAVLPTAAFTFSPQSPGIGENVFFNGQSSSPGPGHSSITSYRWTFGDGATGSGATVSHAYAAAGSYGVQLSVTDEAGQVGTSAATTVTVGSPPTPTAAFDFSPQNPTPTQAVTFDASTSTTAQGQTIKDYAFTFGDGSSTVHSSGPVVSHSYPFAGTFAITLVVTDTANRTNSTSKTIQVIGGDNTQPTVLITATPNPANVNTEVAFQALIQNNGAGGTSITSYRWDFGDGSPQFVSSNANVGYTYRTTGNFTVRVTVTNNLGKQGSNTLQVTIQ